MRQFKNQNGFTGLEGILVGLLVLAIAGLGYFAYQARQDKKDPQPVAQKQEQVSTGPKTETAILKGEKLTLTYLADWTVSNTTETSPLTGELSDTFKAKTPNGKELVIRTGMDGLGGNCMDCVVVKSVPVTAAGKSLYINYVNNQGSTTEFTGMTLAASATCSAICTVEGKNLTYNGQPLPYLAYMNFSEDATKSQPVSSITGDPEVVAIAELFKSLRY